MFLAVKNGAIKISLRAATRAVKSCIVSVDAVVQASAHYSSAVSQVSAISSRFNETKITSPNRRTLLKVIKGPISARACVAGNDKGVSVCISNGVSKQ